MKLKSIAIPLVASLTAMTVQANPPYAPNLAKEGNRWLITAYHDASPVHQQWATQGLCFYPSGVQGTQQLFYWVSDTFPNWNGRAVQEGDQVFMHGDYARDVGHDSMVWEITTASRNNEGYGHWTEWREDGRLGRTVGFLNAKFERVGRCRPQTYEEALDLNQQLDMPRNKAGEEIVVPSGLTERELKELDASVM